MSGPGGSRPGAGRKRQLSLAQRIAIAAMCERLFKEAWEQRVVDDWNARPGAQKVDAAVALVRSIPPDKRAKFIQSGRLDEARRAIESAIREFKGTPEWFTRTFRGVERRAPRPIGVWPQIEKHVAAVFSEKWSITVSPRMVQRCRAEMRAMADKTAPGV